VAQPRFGRYRSCAFHGQGARWALDGFRRARFCPFSISRPSRLNLLRERPRNSGRSQRKALLDQHCSARRRAPQRGSVKPGNIVRAPHMGEEPGTSGSIFVFEYLLRSHLGKKRLETRPWRTTWRCASGNESSARRSTTAHEAGSPAPPTSNSPGEIISSRGRQAGTDAGTPPPAPSSASPPIRRSTLGGVILGTPPRTMRRRKPLRWLPFRRRRINYRWAAHRSTEAISGKARVSPARERGPPVGWKARIRDRCDDFRRRFRGKRRGRSSRKRRKWDAVLFAGPLAGAIQGTIRRFVWSSTAATRFRMGHQGISSGPVHATLPPT